MAIFSDRKRKRRRKKRRHHVRVKHRSTPAPKAAPQPPAPPPNPPTTPTSQPTPSQPAQPTAPTQPAATVATSRERLFLNRFGTGFTQATLAALRASGSPESWFTAQLSPDSITENANTAQLDEWFSFLRRTPAEKYATNAAKTKAAWEYGHDLGNWSILRRIYSQRTVLETMTDFWSTVLHIPVGHDRAWAFRYDYDATIRANAFGRFEDMLIATALHPAMRLYLDNWLSVKNKPNENQGREILELHTVGRAAGYTEPMVKASARLLSGYTVDWGNTFEARYNSAAHTTGESTVLDFTAANAAADGQATTIAYLKYLANHPATAQNLARKLATYFVSDSPSDNLVNTLAGVYLSSGTDIKAVLDAIAASPEFLTSEGQKVRTPIADMVATARVLDVMVVESTATNAYTHNANWVHGSAALFSWPRPDGPPITGRMWSSASRVFASYNMHISQAGGWWPKGATYRTGASWLPATSMRFDAFVQHLSKSFLGRAADARLLAAASQITGVRPETLVTARHAVAGWMFPWLAVALLDTPDHMTT